MSRVTGLIKFAVIGAVLGLTFFGNTYKLAEAAGPATWYVSLNGSNADGMSWATAWSDLNKVNWSVVWPGDTIVIDGGTSTCSVSPYDFQSTSPNPGVTCGARYSPFAVGQNGITIAASTDIGRNGTVVIDGGRDTPLPYCQQPSYSAASGSAYGIDFAGYTGVVIDGRHRSGIVVRGAQNGVRMGPGGNDTLRNMELFDNGYPTTISGGYNSDGNDILMGGQNNTYDRLLVHDGGQDEFHSDSSGYSEAGSQVTNSWMGAMREHPKYPGEPFNDLQAVGQGCTHADGIQIFAPGTTMSGLTIDHDVIGPGVNQGLYPSDSGTGTTFENVHVTNTLFLDAAQHNIISDNGVHGWVIDHVTLFATQSGFELPSDGTNTITNVIKFGGYVYTPGGTWSMAGSIWYGGDPLPGSAANINPNFVSAPTGNLPSFASLRAANLSPLYGGTAGSPLHSFANLLARIDALVGT